MDPIAELEISMQRAVAAYFGPGMTKAEWERLAAALRSGRYPQAQGFAFEPNGRPPTPSQRGRPPLLGD